jgi:pimeloyl-ACP methyl ester carboxylesterase
MVVAPDLLPAKGDYAKTSFSDYTDQVVKWGTAARRPLVVVGASMGGALVLASSVRLKPDLIVLVDSVAPAGVPVEHTEAEVPDIVHWANGPIEDTLAAMPDSDQKTVNWAWKRWRDESGAVMRALSKGVEAPKPACPVLVVWGAKDKDVPLETGRKLAEFCGADFKVYAGTSHVGPLMGRRAKEIAGDVLAWANVRLSKSAR